MCSPPHTSDLLVESIVSEGGEALGQARGRFVCMWPQHHTLHEHGLDTFPIAQKKMRSKVLGSPALPWTLLFFVISSVLSHPSRPQSPSLSQVLGPSLSHVLLSFASSSSLLQAISPIFSSSLASPLLLNSEPFLTSSSFSCGLPSRPSRVSSVRPAESFPQAMGLQ